MCSFTAGEIPESCQTGDRVGDREGEDSEERVCLRRHKGKDLQSYLVSSYVFMLTVCCPSDVCLCVTRKERGSVNSFNRWRTNTQTSLSQIWSLCSLAPGIWVKYLPSMSTWTKTHRIIYPVHQFVDNKYFTYQLVSILFDIDIATSAQSIIILLKNSTANYTLIDWLIGTMKHIDWLIITSSSR